MTNEKPTGLDIAQQDDVDDTLGDLFTYIPSFLEGRTENENAFILNLMGEINTTRELKNNKSVSAVYVVSEPNIVNFPCIDMSLFKYIPKLLSIINSFIPGTPLNACVINQYSKGSAREGPHADNESYMDITSPVCTFSIGGNRDFFVYKNVTCKGSPKKLELIKSMTLENGSLTTMHPPCQSYTRHHIQPGPTDRWSISFRRVIPSVPKRHEWPYNYNTPHTPRKLPPPVNTLPVTPKLARKNSIDGSTLQQENLLNLIPRTNLETCRKLLVALNNRIVELEGKALESGELDKLVIYEPDFASEPYKIHNVSINIPNINTDSEDIIEPLNLNATLDNVRSEVNELCSTSKTLSTTWVIEDDVILMYLT